MPEALQRCIAGYNHSVSALGYSGGRLSVYVTDNGQFCFYPMWQPNSATGEKALIVPVFCKHKSGNWYRSAVLHQYELASIAEMANDKTLGFNPDYTNLLPVGITAGREGDAVFKTADDGFWKVKTTCIKDEITCTALFVRPDGAVRIAHELTPKKYMV